MAVDAEALRQIAHVGWMYPTGFLRDPDVTNADIREVRRGQGA
jgi:hypothetical protein